MGKVTEQLIDILKRQVADRGVVVWYDAQRAYGDLVKQLVLPGTDILHYEEGFFRLRQQLEPFLECVTENGELRPDADQPPAVVLYVPKTREESGHALIEAETAGVVLEPGAAPSDCNTRLGALAEQVFAEIAPAKATHLARQADDGLLTLAELDRLAEETGSSATGALQIVYGKVSAEEILLQFLASDSKDQALIDKKALMELAALIRNELGWGEEDPETPGSLREPVRRYVLASELLLQMPEDEAPDAMRRLPLPQDAAQRELVRRLCGIWRNRVDLKEHYVDAAATVEKAGGLSAVTLPLSHLATAETFASLERAWLDHAAELLAAGEAAEARDAARVRLPLFWAREDPGLQLEWRVIEAAAEVVLESAQIRKQLKQRKWSLDEIVQAYTTYADPWMGLDRAARQMEMRYARLDLLDASAGRLEKAVALSRQRYAGTLHVLASEYGLAAAEAKFRSRRFEGQTSVFKSAGRAALDEGGKTAFFMVDALRFEMAAELIEGLGADYDGRLEPMLGQLPGITAVGMAALLPGADQGLTVINKAGGLRVVIGSRTVTSRSDRLAWLEERSDTVTKFYRLGEVVKLTPKRRKEITAASLVVVTSQEIDRLGEGAGDEEETRVYMQEALEKLRRAVRSLARAGVCRFVIAADHGFQMLEGIDPGMLMDAPGGKTVEVHPRVWIGAGGGAAGGYRRFKAGDLELGGALEFVFPHGLGVFKIKGGVGSYFHGGVSPQEHILPLLTIEVRNGGARVTSVLKFKLTTAKPRITNRLFTVRVEAETKGLFPAVEKRVRLDVLAGKRGVGSAVAAAYGFEEGTREIGIKVGEPNVVTLMIQVAETPKTITVQVLDCETQLVLAALKDLPVELGI